MSALADTIRPDTRMGNTADTEWLRAPFPWFGGKSRVAEAVWQRFGHVDRYIEPFFGSGAVLLGRPSPRGRETVNDLDGYVVNFWRAVAWAPDAVASWADWPTSEIDLHARHEWLAARRDDLTERLRRDPMWYDAQLAGWWVWGMSNSISLKFATREPMSTRPNLRPQGIVPARSSDNLGTWMRALADRLRDVQICCGDWSRVCAPSVLAIGRVVGVFLDPPYCPDIRDPCVYAVDDSTGTLSAQVRDWAIEAGRHPQMRIALCGYDGEHDMPSDWTHLQWVSHGGYGSMGQGPGEANRHRERIWFSPHCVHQPTLF